MQLKPKCAVIGVGVMGKNHVRTYAQIPQIDFVAISDINEKEGYAISKKFNIKFYKNYEKMIAVEKPDIVSICTPTKSHYKIAKNCIEHKINLLLEKPITNNLEKARKLVMLAEKNNIKFLVGHIERHNPAVKKVKEMIDTDKLGKITSIISRRVGGFPPQIKDVNIAVDLAIHDIDIINYLLNSLPDKIHVNKQNNYIKKRADSVQIFMQYKKKSAYIQANWITPIKIRKLNITGTKGYLEMDYITQKINYYKSNHVKFKRTIDDFSDYILRFSEPEQIDIAVEKKEPLKEELLYLINCVKNNIKINSQFAVDALKIALI